MQGPDEYHRHGPQAYPTYPLVISAQNSTHDMNKTLPGASSGMYALNASMPGMPQQHQPGQTPTTSMMQQMNQRSMIINAHHFNEMQSIPSRPNPSIPNMSRNPITNQGAPQGPQQYPQHVQNVMLQSHHNLPGPPMSAQSMMLPQIFYGGEPQSVSIQSTSYCQPPVHSGMNISKYPPRATPPVGYHHQQFYITAPHCYPSYNPAPTNSTYYPVPHIPCQPPLNNMPENQQPLPKSQKKLLTIVNPDTGEDVLGEMLHSGNSSAGDTRESSRQGGSQAAIQFASQVAVLAKDPTTHREVVAEPHSTVCSDSFETAENEEDATDYEVPDICDSYAEEDQSPKEKPILSYPGTVCLEENNIDSSVPEVEDDKMVPQTQEDVINVCIPEFKPAALEDATPVLALAGEPELIVSDVGLVKSQDTETNCESAETSEIALSSSDDAATTPVQLDANDTLSASPVSADNTDETSNNIYEDNSSYNAALKTEKVEARKTNKLKKKELNRKGDSKEGGEMDAFYCPSDSTPTSPPEVETPPLPSAAVIPVLPAASEPEDSQMIAAPESVLAAIQDSTLLNSVPLPTEEEKAPEVSQDAVVTPAEEEEPELPAESADKKLDAEPVQAEMPKPSLKYSYKEDQWSPLNPEGKKQYDRDFLLKLQSLPISMKKPDNLPMIDQVTNVSAHQHKLTDNVRMPPVMPQIRSSGFDFMPAYAQNRQMQRPPHPGVRRSQQGREKPKKIIAFSSSLNQQVKLHESQNAWKPNYKPAVESPEVQELYKKVRGILNKLTPQKFDTLLHQVKELEINTEERLNGVIDLVFEKAIDEPNFSVPYANMCKQLAMLKVPASETSGQHVNFRKLLLMKCQKEFEQDRSDQLQHEEKLRQMETTDSEEKRKQLEEEIEEEERKNRRRQLGNIRFIGELFKLGMLTEPIMHECIKKLLAQGDEDSLECLCRLLTTIGKELETRQGKCGEENDHKKDIMNGYFNEMQRIVDKRKTSSRVRFMLQDVIDLKKRGWVPRRDEGNPKTIDQIHEEVQREAHEKQQMLQNMTFTPKRPSDDNRRKGPNIGRGSTGYEDGWITSSRGSKSSVNFDPAAALKLTKPQEVEKIQLGPGKNFTSWGRGSSAGNYKSSADSETKPAISTNRYSALAEPQSNDSRRGSQRSSASSRESSRGRNNNSSNQSPHMRKTPSITKDQEKAIEAVAVFTRTGQIEPKIPEPTKVPNDVNGKDVAAPVGALRGSDLSPEEITKKTHPLIDEFLHNNDIKEAINCVTELASPRTIHLFINEAINQVLDRSSQARHMFGQLLHNLVKLNIINMEQCNQGIHLVLQYVDDFVVDMPKVWEYWGEIIEPIIESNPSSLRAVKDTLKPCIPSMSAGKLMSAILHCAVKTRGNMKVCEMWKDSGLQWKDFLGAGDSLENFIAAEKLDFTLNPSKSVPAPQLTISQMKDKFEYYLTGLGDDNNNEIFDWIEGNVGDRITEPAFVRALVTAIVQNAIYGSADSCEMLMPKLKARLPLLVKYVSKQEDLQLQALYAIQALINSLDQPKGILSQIFNSLYDDEIILEEVYKKWEQSTDPAEQLGKGVALSSVAPFFTWLREADDDEEEESEDG